MDVQQTEAGSDYLGQQAPAPPLLNPRAVPSGVRLGPLQLDKGMECAF